MLVTVAGGCIVVHGLSIMMADLGYLLGKEADHWYGQARTMPYAQAAGDALDEGLSVALLPATAGIMSRALNFSFAANGLSQPDECLEQIVVWASADHDGNAGLRAALLLPESKLKRLGLALQRYHPHPMRLTIYLNGAPSFQALDVSTGSSRKKFANSAPIIESVSVEFAIGRLV